MQDKTAIINTVIEYSILDAQEYGALDFNGKIKTNTLNVPD